MEIVWLNLFLFNAYHALTLWSQAGKIKHRLFYFKLFAENVE